jgi:hypothetical protein
MSVRRQPAKVPGSTPPRGGGNARAGGAGKRLEAPPTGPGGRSWAFWRQAASIVLLAILMLSGLAAVAMSSTGLVPALVFGALVIALVVAMWFIRAAR